MENKTNWIKIKTSRFFIFYALNKNIGDKDYYNKCDRHVKKVCKIFNFNVDKIKKVKYYILSNKDEYKRILGRESYGEIRENCIYSVHKYHPHEITHIIMHKFLGNGRLKIFSEGVAVLYGWDDNGPLWHSKPLEHWLNMHYKEVDLKQLIKNFNYFDSTVSYPIAGCFVKFFIEKFGMSKFKKTYRNVENSLSKKEQEKIIEKITNMTLGALINSFYNYYNIDRP